MTLAEIKAAVQAGRTVHWVNASYSVVLTSPGPGNRLTEDQWLLRFSPNGHCIGLTHADGVTLNGQEYEFYSLPKQPTQTTALATIKTFPGMTAFATGCGAEICIRILGSPKDHGYFTDDPAEAIATARHMAGIAAHVPHSPKS